MFEFSFSKHNIFMKKTKLIVIYSVALLTIFALIGIGYSQNRGVLEVYGRLEKNNSAMTDGEIKIILDGVVTEVVNTNILGRFEFYLQYDKNYIVEFSGPGLITKRLSFDTSLPERASRRTYREFNFVLDLFTFVEQVDLSFFDEELVKIEYNIENGEFSFSEQETLARLEKATQLKREVEDFLRKKQNYDKLISQADNQYNNEDYKTSRESYISASAIFPEEEYPIERINHLNELLAKKDAKDKKIRDIIEEAESLLAENKFDEAQAKFLEAMQLDPGNTNLQARINNVKQKQTQYKQLSGDYSALITKADEAYNSSLHRTSLDLYKQALALKPNEEYPKKRIDELNGIIAELREKERLYNEAIEKADNFYRVLDYENALDLYKEALSYKPDEKHPRDRVDAINRHMLNVQQREEQYKKFIAEGDNAFNQKDYPVAIEAFRQASGLKPAEVYPKERIALAEKLMRELEDKQWKYKMAIEAGDNAFSEKKYSDALSSFRTASNIMPDEEYPREMLNKINGILMNRAEIEAKYKEFIQKADQAFENDKLTDSKEFYQEAINLKSNERYPAQRIEEINEILKKREIDANYAEAIRNADAKFEAPEYNEALTFYKEASQLKPTEAYPRQKISEINSILGNLKENEEQYANTIAFADKAFDNKEYSSARDSYQRALGYKPNEAYPKDKIDQIDQILADLGKEENYSKAIRAGDNAFAEASYNQAITNYREALTIRPSEPYPQGKIDEAERLLAELQNLEEQYNTAITQGDDSFSQNSLSNAIDYYQTAQRLKPNEDYPKNKIREINLLLSQQKSLDEQYNSLNDEAQLAFNDNNYEGAIGLYENALELKPGEAFPKEQIEMIQKLIVEQNRINEEYKQAIADADRLFLSRAYQKARDFYETATELKPDESYPQGRLTEIDRILLRQKGVEQAYKEAVRDGDKFFKLESYIKSRDFFRRAREIKPTEKYPKDKLAEIERILSSKVGESASYNAAIETGDKYFTQRQFFQSRDAYQEALSIRPNEDYPQKRIIEINKLIAKSAEMNEFYSRGFMDVSNVREELTNNSEKKYYFVPFDRRRTGSYLLVKGENLSEKPLRLFVNYGKDNSRYGGFTVSIGEDKGVQELKIDISSQRRWISDECNWISIYPQGGDLDVLQVQIYFGSE